MTRSKRMFARLSASLPTLALASALLLLAVAPSRAADDFGTEVAMVEQRIVYLSGSGTWDTAYDTLVAAFKTVNAYLDKEGVKPAGLPLMIYTGADSDGFRFQAAVPIADDLPNLPQGDIAVGTSPAGRAYKFVHRGSYDTMENMFEAIMNFFDEKNIEVKDTFIEEFVTDPRSTPEEDLVINVLVPAN